MATSLYHGATSLDLNQGLVQLKCLLNTDAINKLRTALGSEAQLHLVGGAVRDTLLGKENHDIDLTTKLKPEEVLSLLKKAGIRTEPTGIEHGTLLAVFADIQIELTTFRAPGRARTARGPEIFSTSIEQDLAGRDFTINALAYSLDSNKIVDPFNGLADLAQNTIRAVGDPDARFMEDPLRILRMVRFGPANKRNIEEHTFASAKKLAPHIDDISQERIRDEFIKIICAQSPAEALRKLRECGALDIVLPEIVPSYDFEQNEFHRFDVFEHTLAVLENCPNTPLLRLTAVFHDVGKPATLSVGPDGRRHFYKHEIVSTNMTKTALKRLRCSNQMIKEVGSLVRYHMRPLNCGPAAVRRLVRDLGPLMEPWLEFKAADSKGAKVAPKDINQMVQNFRGLLKTELSRGDFLKLAVSGDDIKNFGIAEGPVIGHILNALRELVLNEPELNDRDKLLKLAREKFVKQ